MEEMQKRRRQVWAHACGWVEDPDALHVVGGEENRVVRAGRAGPASAVCVCVCVYVC